MIKLRKYQDERKVQQTALEVAAELGIRCDLTIPSTIEAAKIRTKQELLDLVTYKKVPDSERITAVGYLLKVLDSFSEKSQLGYN